MTLLWERLRFAATHASRSVPSGFDSSWLHFHCDHYGFCGSGFAPVSNPACGLVARIRVLTSVRRRRNERPVDRSISGEPELGR